MPLQRRLPKVGFRSRKSLEKDEVRLTELNLVAGDVVDLETLRAAGVLNRVVKNVKIIASGTVTRALTIRGLGVTKGARAAIEAAGGSIED